MSKFGPSSPPRATSLQGHPAARGAGGNERATATKLLEPDRTLTPGTRCKIRLLDGQVLEVELERVGTYTLLARLGATRLVVYKHAVSLIVADT